MAELTLWGPSREGETQDLKNTRESPVFWNFDHFTPHTRTSTSPLPHPPIKRNGQSWRRRTTLLWVRVPVSDEGGHCKEFSQT